MAEIRCPMCGKSNPDHLDVCQFCEARLKPLIASSPDDDIFGFQDESDEESLPDWFDTGSGDFGDADDGTPFDGGSDDWLTRLGGDSEPGEAAAQIDHSRATSRMDFDGDGTPDWLQDLEDERTTPPMEEEISPAESGDMDMQTWLSADEEGEESPFDDGGLPDWLLSDDEEMPSTEGAPAISDDEGLPSWLSAEEGIDEPAIPAVEDDFLTQLTDTGDEIGIPLEKTTPIEDVPPIFLADEEEAKPAVSAAEGDLPAWLTDMEGAEAGAPEGEPPAFEPEEGELPDWLAGGEEEAVEPAIPAAEGDFPTWLTDMEGAEAGAPEGEPPAFEPEEGELPDWLAGGEEEAVEPAIPAAEGEMPAWLTDMEGAEAVTPEEEAPAFAAEEGELPDWLAGGEEEAVEPAIPAAEGEMPAWLTDMEGAEAGIPEEVTPAFAAEEGELPDWLAGGEEEAVEPAIPAAEGEMPAWLADMEGAEAAPPEEEAPAFGAEEGELPDWLAGGEEEAVEPAIPAAEGEMPAWLADMEGAEEVVEAGVPDWVSELDEGIVSADAQAEESRAVPDWLQDMEVPAAAIAGITLGDEEQAEPTSVAPFTADEEFDDVLSDLEALPSWVSEEAGPQAEAFQEGADLAGDDLAPAELPGWLAAMRPVDSGVVGAGDDQPRGPIESSGPLAGLHSVLAVEPEITRFKKPPVYSNKLNVTEAQQTNVALLQELLEAESKPQVLPAPPLVSGQRVFRTVLGAILVLIAFLTVLGGSQIATMPASGDMLVEANHVSQLVNLLTPQDTILIAFDYEPGLAGEMEATAAALVDHILLKGAKLALISSSPTGPALAERFINSVQSQHGYVSGTQYVNLGYIPGGMSGLAAFAQNPRWSAPNALDYSPAWEAVSLQNITTVADFAMLVVITDNPNTARGWVEQVHPHLQDTPMITVVSAQVEPMIRPYRDSQQAQIAGLISGLPGGASYEVVSRANLARKYWDAFNITLVVAVGAIVIGGGFTVVSDILARRKKSGGEST